MADFYGVVGRQSEPAPARRDDRLTVRFDPAERLALAEAARASGVSEAEFTRGAVSAAFARRAAPAAANAAEQPAGAAPSRWSPETDQTYVAATAAVGALDSHGLKSELPAARELLARRATLVREVRQQQGAATAARERLAGRLASGDLAPGDLPAEALAAAWPAEASHAADEAARVLAHQAREAARREMPAAFDALGRLADETIAAGIEPARRLVDVDGAARALREFAKRSDREQLFNTPWTRGLPRPTLPAFDAAAMERQPELAGHLAAASGALRRYREIFDSAEMVCRALRIGRVLRFGEDANEAALTLLRVAETDKFPEVAMFALADALGVRPGLFLTMRPAAPRPPEGKRSVDEVALAARELEQSRAAQLLG